MSTSILLTDLYELTMLEAYFEQRMNGRAVFELFVRKLPPHRNFLIAAGLAQVLDYLTDLRFAEDDLAWLNACGRFTPAFVGSLADSSLYRRRRCAARGHGILCRRADPPHQRALA